MEEAGRQQMQDMLVTNFAWSVGGHMNHRTLAAARVRKAEMALSTQKVSFIPLSQQLPMGLAT
eukprot:756951-Amphidinium_carterae.1